MRGFRFDVGAVHVLRHVGALARLQQTGNPQATAGAIGPYNGQDDPAVLKDLDRPGSGKDQSAGGLSVVVGFTHGLSL